MKNLTMFCLTLEPSHLDFIKKSPQGKRYHSILHEIQHALSFIDTVEDSRKVSKELRLYEFYTSHEGLLLEYEFCIEKNFLVEHIVKLINNDRYRKRKQNCFSYFVSSFYNFS